MRFNLLLLIVCLLPACNSSAPDNTTDPILGLAVPRVIADTRGVDLSDVRPIVTLSDNRAIAMTANGNTWTGSINVEPNSVQRITIAWWISIDGRDLELANSQQMFDVDADGIDVQIDASTVYSTNIDTDNDEVSNLAELQNETDPFTADNPPIDVDLLVSRIALSQAPVIDGLNVTNSANDSALIGEWQGATQRDRSGSQLFINNLLIDSSSDQPNGDPIHRWAVAHDGTFLYIVVLSDDIGAHLSDSSGLEGDDSIEIYIDGDNSKTDDYADDNDIYVQISLLEEGNSSSNNSELGNPRFAKGFYSSPLPEDIRFATGPNAGPLSVRDNSFRQDVYEVRLNLEQLGIDAGEPFGIEIQINDDDDGGSRDGKWAWIHPALGTTGVIPDNTWRNPSLMGTAMLQ